MTGEQLASLCFGEFERAGFVPLKPHTFARRTDGVIQIASFQPDRTDCYLWYMAMPLGYPDLKLNRGCEGLCGRLPASDNPLSLKEKGEEAVKQAIRQELVSVGLPRLADLRGLEQLVAAIDTRRVPHGHYVRAFCYFQLGRYPEGRASLAALMSDPRVHDGNQWGKNARRFIESSDADIASNMAQQIADNVKKNRLTRLANA